MKKIFIFTFILIIPFISMVSAVACSPTVSLLNQDPYPAIPNNYVKLVFQVTNLGGSECGKISFQLMKDYPLEFDPGETGIRTFDSLNYIKDYQSKLQIPYQVRLDKDALDGANEITVSLKNNNDASILKTFNIEVDGPDADFEVYIRNYDYNENKLTIEVLNIAEIDVEALTIEIPKQENINVKGTHRIVAGDLDSNEYTTVDFEAIPKDGDINLVIIYSDSINKRRTLEKTINFDSSYFKGRVADENKTPTSTYILWVLIIGIVIYWFMKKRKKKKAAHHARHHR